MNKTGVCPRCGTTAEEFRKTGLVGCMYCYLFLQEEVLPAVSYLQGATRHTGASPAAGSGEQYDFILEQERLKEAIERALREGRYVDMAELQKKLRTSNRFKREGGDA